MHQPMDPDYWLREHGPKLLAFACQWVDCRAEAEDVFQEAFVRFWQTRDSVREPLLYLYRCVRNAALDRARSAARRQRHERAAAPPAGEPLPEAPLDQRERERKINEAVAKLPPQQREVVALRSVERHDLRADRQNPLPAPQHGTRVVRFGDAAAPGRTAGGIAAMTESWDELEAMLRAMRLEPLSARSRQRILARLAATTPPLRARRPHYGRWLATTAAAALLAAIGVWLVEPCGPRAGASGPAAAEGKQSANAGGNRPGGGLARRADGKRRL